jgi:hypothetical protein
VKLRIKLPEEAAELLREAAQKSNMPVEDFARVCIFSVLANYAKSQDFDPETTIPPSDVSDTV